MQSVKLSVTVRRNLERKYDPAALKQIDAAVKRWVAADAARGIKTVHVALDDAVAMKKLGVAALKGAATAEKMKTAIDRLWTRLAPEYLLFGSQDVVPISSSQSVLFTRRRRRQLVPTDNPYACSGAFRKLQRSSYLVPDRVVGRIPTCRPPRSLLAARLHGDGHKRSSRPGTHSPMRTRSVAMPGSAGLKCVGTSARRRRNPDFATGGVLRRMRARIWCEAHDQMSWCTARAVLRPKGDSYPDALCGGMRLKVKAQILAAAMCCYGAQVYSPNDPP